MRTILASVTAILVTPVLAGLAVVASLLRVRDRPGGVYDKVPAWWSRAVLTMAGVELRTHNAERIAAGAPRIFVCNHVSWFDVFAVAATLPRGKFVAKAELFKIPLFGLAMRVAGMIAIERENRKAAFASYEVAAKRIREGTPVVVFPEGTRGFSYELRPFKKGPFVLAIASGVPIVPMVLHGTMEVMGKRSWRVRSGVVDLHFLPEVPTASYAYEDRERLMRVVHDRMAAALHDLYRVGPGVLSTPLSAPPAASRNPSSVAS